jgi:hypothetical protein
MQEFYSENPKGRYMETAKRSWEFNGRVELTDVGRNAVNRIQ